jgi:protein-tyrosine phosphatase
VPLRPSTSVLFVCLGNICRSPTAEGVFRAQLARAGLAQSIEVDSAGTGEWNVGAPVDPRAAAAARRRGYDLGARRARTVEVGDFERFGWILAMDRDNLEALRSLRTREFRGHLGLLLDFAPELGVREVPDPYGGGPAGFEHVLDVVELGCAALLAKFRAAP